MTNTIPAHSELFRVRMLTMHAIGEHHGAPVASCPTCKEGDPVRSDDDFSDCPDCLDAFTCRNCEEGCSCPVPAASHCPDHGVDAKRVVTEGNAL